MHFLNLTPPPNKNGEMGAIKNVLQSVPSMENYL